jgi:hypothetical protein
MNPNKIIYAHIRLNVRRQYCTVVYRTLYRTFSHKPVDRSRIAMMCTQSEYYTLQIHSVE